MRRVLVEGNRVGVGDGRVVRQLRDGLGIAMLVAWLEKSTSEERGGTLLFLVLALGEVVELKLLLRGIEVGLAVGMLLVVRGGLLDRDEDLGVRLVIGACGVLGAGVAVGRDGRVGLDVTDRGMRRLVRIPGLLVLLLLLLLLVNQVPIRV